MCTVFLTVTNRLQTVPVNETQTELPTTQEVFQVPTKRNRPHLPPSHRPHSEQITVLAPTSIQPQPSTVHTQSSAMSGQSIAYTPTQQEQTTLHTPIHLTSGGRMLTTEHHITAQSRVTLTTQDVLRCLDDGHSPLTMETDEVWLTLAYAGNTSGSPLLRKPSTCLLQIGGRGQGILSLLIFNMSCVKNNVLVVHSQMKNRHSYDCQPSAWVAPGTELAMTSNFANVSIEISDVNTPVRLHAQFKIVPDRQRYSLETRKVTQYLGTSHLLSSQLTVFEYSRHAVQLSIKTSCQHRHTYSH